MTTLETISNAQARAGYAKWFVRQHYLHKDYHPNDSTTGAWRQVERLGRLRYCKEVETWRWTDPHQVWTHWYAEDGFARRKRYTSLGYYDSGKSTIYDETWFEIPLEQVLGYFDSLDRKQQWPKLPAHFYAEDADRHIGMLDSAHGWKKCADEDAVWRWLIGEADHWVVFYTAWIQAHGVNVRDL